jgi:hypothetical protein
MDVSTVTRCLIYGTAILWAVYDLAVLLAFGPRATISVALYEDSRRFPVIAIVIGLVVGHVFWPVWGDQ